MRRPILILLVFVLAASTAQAQIGMPGVEYSTSIAAGEGGQLYPYDQQDPWIHGHFQRVPAYGGFASFRPYNYRHVFSQTQIASGWGSAHGMPYSQQFWNKYRGSYLQGNLHSSVAPSQRVSDPNLNSGTNYNVIQFGTSQPIYQTSFSAVSPGSYHQLPSTSPQPNYGPGQIEARPVHVFPEGIKAR